MTDYTKLVEALRGMDNGDSCPCEYYMMCEDSDCVLVQAAAAIEALQARLPKRGEWYTELYDGDKKYQCSNCLTHWDVETRYCPFCGAKMEVQE